jgi:2-dehydropantoate 2-reductase
MVSFNVLHRRATAAFTAAPPGRWWSKPGRRRCRRPHLDIVTHPDMEAVLAGKLVYNLNNALNACPA